ncbi:MAG TPA: UDP-N-acetylmuramoyl-tripeptide--D-alanyl-D-alanine ligase [Patescibacteria group bacterium]|nr:UDP-N-acetylmuramoyl-tripeptide--D-alanyl-D-alanine ligase [Patescibacteria group bacterium]
MNEYGLGVFNIFITVLFFSSLVSGTWSVLQLLQVLQQEEYDLKRFLFWVGHNKRKWLFKIVPKLGTKKPLKWTLRAILICALALVFHVCLPLFFLVFSGDVDSEGHSIVRLLLFAVFPKVFSWLSLLLALYILYPLVWLAKKQRVEDAYKVLQEVKPITIGIAGSFGKTSVKYFLHAILSEKFNTEMTKESYNTLLGIASEVKAKVKSGTEVFIAEMGVYTTGEVTQMCELVRPTYGIMTAIGPEHFERFRHMDKILEANSELIIALPTDGIIALNSDNEFFDHLQKLANSKGLKCVAYGLNAQFAKLTAVNIRNRVEGVEFDLMYEGQSMRVNTQVLGKFAVTNILGAASLALELGMSMEQVVAGISKIKSAEHRLQIIPGHGGVTVIDDAYNSNPEGFKEALRVLRDYPGKRKILVTPGMVELGKLQAEKHFEVANLAKDICDYIIIVGMENAAYFAEELHGSGFDESKFYMMANLEAAQKVLGEILQPGDVVLFENDLPDIYS